MRKPSSLTIFRIFLTTIAGFWFLVSYKTREKEACCAAPLDSVLTSNTHPKDRVFQNDDLENLLSKQEELSDMEGGGNEQLSQQDNLQSRQVANVSTELLEAERRIEQRMKHLREQCEELRVPHYKLYNLYYFDRFNVAWCPTFKASSSTWRDFFIDEMVGGYAKHRSGQKYHLGMLEEFALGHGKRDWSNSPRKLKFSGERADSTRFTVVRHPLSRLISHLLKAQNLPYEVKRQKDVWTREAIMNGRDNRDWDDMTRLKYEQELNTYISELEPAVDHQPYSPDNPYLHPPYPTFVEMVNFIMKHRTPRVDQKGANGHWRPAVEFCDVCMNTLDIIIHLEEEPAELMVLLNKLGLMRFKDRLSQKHNASKQDADNSKSKSKDLMKQYADMLNNDQIRFLNKMYAKDYMLLGYEPIPER